jgi:hypothetical protein
MRRASLSTEIVFIEGMSASLRSKRDAILQHVASWGDRIPHAREIMPTANVVKPAMPATGIDRSLARARNLADFIHNVRYIAMRRGAADACENILIHVLQIQVRLIQFPSHECGSAKDAGAQLAAVHPPAAGAAGLSEGQDAVHALPMNEETQEDFEWLIREIVEGGGEAFLCEARLIDGLTDEEVRTLFDKARDADYGDIAKEARSLAKSLRPKLKAERLSEYRAQTARLRKRLAEVVAIDFFGAIGRETAEALLAGLETRLNEDVSVNSKATEEGRSSNVGELRGRTWVTRQGVYVDRIGSAWLIRRFIDPDARFKFVAGKGYRPEPGELRFDMFEAEFTHEGDKCTFEVLLERHGPKDAALRAIGEIVHDIDLKDGKFGRTEVAGIKTLIEGISGASKDDDERIERGTDVFNTLYDFFKKRRR